MRRGVAALIALAALAAPGAAAAITGPIYDELGRLVDTPFVPEPAPSRLEEPAVLDIALATAKVRDWVARYPAEELQQRATFDERSRVWTAKVWAGDAGQIALVKVSDDSGRVREAWTGPQVAWTMARGYKGAFGRKINDPAIWFGLTALFLVGLASWRRPLSLRNLDLLVLVSFSASLWFFNRGEVFTSVPLAYPPLVYLLLRMIWIGLRGRRPPEPRERPVWPVWLLAVAALFLLGFRIGLNVERSNVIDVGYAGVIGASRIVDDGQSPYGHFPVRRGEECGRPDANGVVRERIQTNGRCESSNDRGDTYGPVTYVAYVPGVLAFGWSGKWDALPAAHFTAIMLDVVALAAVALVGWRFGRAPLAATLAFAWVAYPFTQYVSSSNSNDAIVPALLAIGFWAATSAPARGLLVGLASWAKFAPLVLVPLWATYRTELRRPRPIVLFAAGFALAAALGFWVLLLEPSPIDAARTFWDRTFGWQLGRDSPFSLWDWGPYRYPDLSLVQTVLKVMLLVGALVVAVVPRRKSPLQLAALTAALLVGFELTLSHWFYLYIPWFFPFVAYALFGPVARRRTVREPDRAPADLPEPALVAP